MRLPQPGLFALEPALDNVPAPDPFTANIPIDLPLIDWMKAHNYHFILCELVLRAKTIEANQLCSAGPAAELDYLRAAYEGDEARLRGDVAELSAYLKRHTMPPRAGISTEALKL